MTPVELFDFWDREISADFLGEQIGNFRVARDGLNKPGPWVHPQRMRRTLSFQVAPILAEVLNECLAFHSTATNSN